MAIQYERMRTEFFDEVNSIPSAEPILYFTQTIIETMIYVDE